MSKRKEKKITTRKEDYSQWYLDVVASADLAENSPVRGCMVIKPYGYSLWENIQKVLDAVFKKTGVKNAYFPLFIPLSFLAKEAEHVEGFAKETAVVTHHRLKLDSNKKLVPDGKLEEPLIVRPTSETIINDTFSRWVNSYRDLPLLINQWANVVRWEMRTRVFLRTTEFLWQEGHTAHAEKEEAEKRTRQMLDVYTDFVRDYLAMSVVPGVKTESEKFAGAVVSMTIEAMMQDGKALQSGTSHFLGQNFAKSFKIKFLAKDGKEKYVWQSSWGFSTRIIGGLIMTHSDDKGLVLPPMIAPIQVVIIPISVKDSVEEKNVMKIAEEIKKSLEKKYIRVEIDARDERPGVKFFEWEKKGVPVRIEIGPKDIVNKSVIVAGRIEDGKHTMSITAITKEIPQILDYIQKKLLENSETFRKEHTYEVDDWKEFKKTLEDKPGFILAHWCGDAKCEEKIQEETKATTRCIPFDQEKEKGKCVRCGGVSKTRIIFAKAY